MRIQIASDLHLEFERELTLSLKAERDVLVLAGDIHLGTKADKFILQELEHSDVVYVFGNHEFYQQVLPAVRRAWNGPTAVRVNNEAREAGYPGRLHVLDNATTEINGVRFVGTTLWTDFQRENPMVMQTCQTGMNDYHVITMRQAGDFGYGAIMLTAYDALHMHRQARDFIQKTLETPYDGPTVVVTHMAPSWQSVDEMFRGDKLNGAFVSDLEPMMCDHKPALWFHGHVHTSFDYMVDDTRVVCNPRGYWPSALNPYFKPDLVLEV